jgi:hypothetical protein
LNLVKVADNALGRDGHLSAYQQDKTTCQNTRNAEPSTDDFENQILPKPARKRAGSLSIIIARSDCAAAVSAISFPEKR